MATKAEQLASVRLAIAKIEAGAQSYTLDGHTFTRANLDVLYKREEQLEQKVARQRRGGIGVRFGIPGNL